MNYPIIKIRSNFPVLNTSINNNRLIYLDSAASCQKPKTVINSQKEFFYSHYATPHRGIYLLSKQSTILMEEARANIAKFINASPEEIIFTKGTTESINLVANSWGNFNINEGDNIIITEMEHHSNIVPWQILAKQKKIQLKYIPLIDNGNLDLSKLSILIDTNTKLVSITQLSNVIGTLNPISEIITKIKKITTALILIDGAQGIAHQTINVQKLNCDFYVFSGHKIYGPPGIGILYGKKYLLNNMPPWETGGGVIKSVSLTEDTTFIDAPWKFEAGTPNITGIIGLNAAINYINSIGLNSIQQHENQLMHYTMESLKQIPNLILYGPNTRIGIIAFNIGKLNSFDIGSCLDKYGIAIRTGHHCAIPLMNYFQVHSMCRISLAMYTNEDDINKAIQALIKIQCFLNKSLKYN